MIMITIRPGPNMDANLAGLVLPSFFYYLILPSSAFLGEKFIMRRSAELVRMFLESLFFLSLSRCFALHFDFNNTPLLLLLGACESHRIGYWASRTQRRIQVIQPLSL
jgi:hypothetical protein